MTSGPGASDLEVDAGSRDLMRRLIILRHAKTEREHRLGDRHRELTARGRRDSKRAGEEILAHAGMPDSIVTSPAVRARQTAEIVAEALGFTGQLVEEPAIYAAGLEELIDMVHALPESVETTLLVGHNPGILELVNWLAGPDDEREHLPTAAFAIASTQSTWKDRDSGAWTVSEVVVARANDPGAD
jgi:phosphohistidine phosphatase